MIKSCQQKELADVWYDKFVQSAVPYDSSSGAPPSTANSGSGSTGRKRKVRVLDEKTTMKCRFASALYEIERSGIIKCSKSSGQNPAVTIERKIYTWV